MPQLHTQWERCLVVTKEMAFLLAPPTSSQDFEARSRGSFPFTVLPKTERRKGKPRLESWNFCSDVGTPPTSLLLNKMMALTQTFVGKAVVPRAAARRSAARASAVSVVARDAPWCPGSDAPAHLNGSLPGALQKIFLHAGVHHRRRCRSARPFAAATETDRCRQRGC